MAAKFDIEIVKKNLFWILLGVVSLIQIAAIVLLLISDPAATQRKEYQDREKEMKAINDFKNEKFLPPWKERKDEFTAEKNVIWEKAWKPQEPIYYFPVGIKKLEYPDEKPTSAELTSYRDRYYKDQFDRFVTEVSSPRFEVEKGGKADRYLLMQGPSPIVFGGAGGSAPGMPGFAGGDSGGSPAMPAGPGPGSPRGEGGAGGPGMAAGGAPVSVSPGVRGILGELPTFTVPPNPEEFWILQEDLSVRREMVYTLRKALAEMAVMTRKPAPNDNPGAIVLVNSAWELTLIPEAGGKLSEKSTLRNVHSQGRPQALYDKALGWKTEFLLAQGANTRVTLSFDGDPLPYGQARSFKEFGAMNVGTLDFSQEFLATQVFKQANCPLRKVAAIELGTLGQDIRNFKPADLKIRATLPEEKGEDLADATPGAPGGPPGMDGGAMGSMMPGGPGAGTAAGPRNATALNRLDRARYLVSNEVCRHLPIAVKLQVDQAYVNTVLSTMANNKLRMQITQVEWNHVPRSRPVMMAGGLPGGGFGFPGAPPGGPPGAGFPPGGPGVAPGGLPGTGFPPGGPGAAPGGIPGVPGVGGVPGRPPVGAPGGPGVGSNPALASLGLEDGNLIDLTIYAIASLYERYPPKPGAPLNGSAPADGAQPAAPIN